MVICTVYDSCQYISVGVFKAGLKYFAPLALWNNANLKTDGICFNYNTWKRKRKKFIQDIVREDGHIITQNDLEKKYSITCRSLEYQRLVIPTA